MLESPSNSNSPGQVPVALAGSHSKGSKGSSEAKPRRTYTSGRSDSQSGSSYIMTDVPSVNTSVQNPGLGLRSSSVSLRSLVGLMRNMIGMCGRLGKRVADLHAEIRELRGAALLPEKLFLILLNAMLKEGFQIVELDQTNSEAQAIPVGIKKCTSLESVYNYHIIASAFAIRLSFGFATIESQETGMMPEYKELMALLASSGSRGCLYTELLFKLNFEKKGHSFFDRLVSLGTIRKQMLMPAHFLVKPFPNNSSSNAEGQPRFHSRSNVFHIPLFQRQYNPSLDHMQFEPNTSEYFHVITYLEDVCRRSPSKYLNLNAVCRSLEMSARKSVAHIRDMILKFKEDYPDHCKLVCESNGVLKFLPNTRPNVLIMSLEEAESNNKHSEYYGCGLNAGSILNQTYNLVYSNVTGLTSSNIRDIFGVPSKRAQKITETLTSSKLIETIKKNVGSQMNTFMLPLASETPSSLPHVTCEDVKLWLQFGEKGNYEYQRQMLKEDPVYQEWLDRRGGNLQHQSQLFTVDNNGNELGEIKKSNNRNALKESKVKRKPNASNSHSMDYMENTLQDGEDGTSMSSPAIPGYKDSYSTSRKPKPKANNYSSIHDGDNNEVTQGVSKERASAKKRQPPRHPIDGSNMGRDLDADSGADHAAFHNDQKAEKNLTKKRIRSRLNRVISIDIEADLLGGNEEQMFLDRDQPREGFPLVPVKRKNRQDRGREKENQDDEDEDGNAVFGEDVDIAKGAEGDSALKRARSADISRATSGNSICSISNNKHSKYLKTEIERYIHYFTELVESRCGINGDFLASFDEILTAGDFEDFEDCLRPMPPEDVTLLPSLFSNSVQRKYFHKFKMAVWQLESVTRILAYLVVKANDTNSELHQSDTDSSARLGTLLYGQLLPGLRQIMRDRDVDQQHQHPVDLESFNEISIYNFALLKMLQIYLSPVETREAAFTALVGLVAKPTIISALRKLLLRELIAVIPDGKLSIADIFRLCDSSFTTELDNSTIIEGGGVAASLECSDSNNNNNNNNTNTNTTTAMDSNLPMVLGNIAIIGGIDAAAASLECSVSNNNNNTTTTTTTTTAMDSNLTKVLDNSEHSEVLGDKTVLNDKTSINSNSNSNSNRFETLGALLCAFFVVPSTVSSAAPWILYSSDGASSIMTGGASSVGTDDMDTSQRSSESNRFDRLLLKQLENSRDSKLQVYALANLMSNGNYSKDIDIKVEPHSRFTEAASSKQDDDNNEIIATSHEIMATSHSSMTSPSSSLVPINQYDAASVPEQGRDELAVCEISGASRKCGIFNRGLARVTAKVRILPGSSSSSMDPGFRSGSGFVPDAILTDAPSPTLATIVLAFVSSKGLVSRRDIFGECSLHLEIDEELNPELVNGCLTFLTEKLKITRIKTSSTHKSHIYPSNSSNGMNTSIYEPALASHNITEGGGSANVEDSDLFALFVSSYACIDNTTNHRMKFEIQSIVLSVLEIYPMISIAQIHPYVPFVSTPQLKAVLSEMVADRLVRAREAASGRRLGGPFASDQGAKGKGGGDATVLYMLY